MLHNIQRLKVWDIRRVFISLFLFILIPFASAQGIDGETDEEIYQLPEAAITETRDKPEVVTRDQMDRDDAADLWEAVRYVPGVIFSNGGRRGDSSFKVRGYGADAVPIFVDGVLMGNPYRGEGDAARFLTGDLESVEIQKGFSSSLLGANTLGGAVLLRTAKPKKPLELRLRTGIGFDSGFGYADSTTVASAGTKLRYFYGKATLQYRDIDHFRLSDDFEPAWGNPQQKGDRLFSDSKDLKVSLMAGVTPVEPLDVWLTYTYQDGDKGVSPPDIRVRETSDSFFLWDWPIWKRQSAALNGAFTNDIYALSLLVYFDKYDNRMDEYLRMRRYEMGIHRPHSDYDEYSLGGRITGKWQINTWNEAEAAVTYKKEDHKGLRGGDGIFEDEETMKEVVHIHEDTWSFGAEWTTRPWRSFSFKAGFGFNALIPIEYWGEENEFNRWLQSGHFTVKTRTMFLYTWQAGAAYDITLDHQIYLRYARKNHFPSMFQRYSTRIGQNLPNPNLGPELANHFELGYTGNLFDKFTINTAVYYSVMNGKIVDVEVPDPDFPTRSVNYARNLDIISFYGFEFTAELFLNKYLDCGFSFSVNKYFLNNTYDSLITAIPYYPEITYTAFAQIKPVPEPLGAAPVIQQVVIIPRIEYIGNRWTNTAGTEELEGYVLAHLKISTDITRYCSIAFSIDNIFDTFYELRYNSPMAGRTYTITLTAKY